MAEDERFSEGFISASRGVMKDNPQYLDALRQAIDLASSDLFGDLRTRRDRKELPDQDPENYLVW